MRYFLLILSIKTKNVRSFLIVDVAAPPIVQEHHAGRIRATVQRAGADREGQLRSGDESQRQIRQVRSHQIFPQGSDQTHEPDHTRNQQPSQTQPHQHSQILWMLCYRWWVFRHGHWVLQWGFTQLIHQKWNFRRGETQDLPTDCWRTHLCSPTKYCASGPETRQHTYWLRGSG